MTEKKDQQGSETQVRAPQAGQQMPGQPLQNPPGAQPIHQQQEPGQPSLTKELSQAQRGTQAQQPLQNPPKGQQRRTADEGDDGEEIDATKYPQGATAPSRQEVSVAKRRQQKAQADAENLPNLTARNLEAPLIGQFLAQGKTPAEARKLARERAEEMTRPEEL